MSRQLREIVQFRGDRLFNGAVNIGWFDSDVERTRAAAEAFVFHGPAYHGVTQDDVGVLHGHQLQDTANFARSVIKRCYGFEEEPFTLAIAGYGTGKSHLGLTLSILLSNPEGEIADVVLQGIERADNAIGTEIRTILKEANKPCLVVALNGMQSFDLTTQVTRQILRQVEKAGLCTRPLDDLRPRFAQAENLVRIAATNSEVVDALQKACQIDSLEEILTRLDQQDETVYGNVHAVLAARNIQISALGGESIRDVIDVACREYCGPEKTFRCMIIIFDEFGRYTEFATIRSHIAGSGVLQDLFEGIQSNTGNACFVGFIQFELNAYVQRVAPEHRNEILRYVTRYQSANRVYLSINLETLIASLIEKRFPEELANCFNSEEAKQRTDEIIANIGRWFPQSRIHRLWNDSAQFHLVVRQGCWPLSAYSTWFLFHLVAAGKHLQERSAISMLGDVFERFAGHQIDSNDSWFLAPVDFWSDSLQHELILSEEGGQQGAITHAYASVFARHESKIEKDLIRLLRAVVLASKMQLKAQDKYDAINAIAELAGLHHDSAEEGVQQLQDEYNVLEWDESFKEFDILGDAVPRTQFLSFLRHRVASTYDEAGKAVLFASKASTWCDRLRDLDCDFAEEHKITTREWRYSGVTSSLDVLSMHVKLAADKWSQAMAVDEPRGTIIYCYVEPSRDVKIVEADVKKLLRTAAGQAGISALPILVVLLCDIEGILGQSIAELVVLDESLSEEDRVRFGNLIPAHQEKMRSVVGSQIEKMIKERLYISAYNEPFNSERLSRTGNELFSRIYTSVLLFPFDGFSTARGNAADSCQDLTAELLNGKLDYDGVLAKPIKIKNRAISVLKDSWGVFAADGHVRTRPSNPVVQSLAEKWDRILASGDRTIPLQDFFRQLCAPPFGANVASAGLFLGVFIAARIEKLCVVRNGQQYAISQWVRDGLFRGKVIDFGALHNVDLIFIGETSSEWETLLDEWEQEEKHLSRKDFLIRALELKERIPVPPALAYRQKHLEELSKASITTLVDMERRKNKGLEKIEAGLTYSDVGRIAWGAVELKNIVDQMKKETSRWTNQQVQECKSSIEQARQEVVQYFWVWLEKQIPDDGTPDSVGDFKHKMLKLTGENLKSLGLEDLYGHLERHVSDVIRNVEKEAEASQALREVRLWLTAHSDAVRNGRVSELRALKLIGREFSSKLKNLNSQKQVSEVMDVRNRLSEMLKLMEEKETSLLNRASSLWDSKLLSVEDMARVEDEVNTLVGAFENCSNDLEDLQIMRRALQLYQNSFRKLSDERLSWTEYEVLLKTIMTETCSTLENEEIPWPPKETLEAIESMVRKTRKDHSVAFVEAMEAKLTSINNMTAVDANNLHSRAVSPPPVITEADFQRLRNVIVEIEKKMDSLKVDWLVEKYKDLSNNARIEFHGKIKKLDHGIQ